MTLQERCYAIIDTMTKGQMEMFITFYGEMQRCAHEEICVVLDDIYCKAMPEVGGYDKNG